MPNETIRVFMIGSAKGGSGKSTIALKLCVALVEQPVNDLRTAIGNLRLTLGTLPASIDVDAVRVAIAELDPLITIPINEDFISGRSKALKNARQKVIGAAKPIPALSALIKEFKTAADAVLRKVCLLDTDFTGTSWAYIFQNAIHYSLDHNSRTQLFDLPGAAPADYSHLPYMNRLVRDWDGWGRRHQLTLDLFVQPYKLGVPDNNPIVIPSIICSPAEAEKAAFRPSLDVSSPALSIDLFRFNVLKLLRKLVEDGFRDFVMDMPPGTESFADALQNIFTSTATAFNEKMQPEKTHTWQSYLYLVSSTDRSHVGATYDRLVELVQHSPITRDFSGGGSSPLQQIRMVINDMTDLEGREEGRGGVRNKGRLLEFSQTEAEALNGHRDIRDHINGTRSMSCVKITQHLVSFDLAHQQARNSHIYNLDKGRTTPNTVAIQRLDDPVAMIAHK